MNAARSMVAGQLVQGPRGVRLRRQHGVEPLGRQRGEHAVVECPGGVHDGGERPVQARQQPLEGGAVGDVARGDRDVGVQVGQLAGGVVRRG